jgi:hypothetical protein
MTRGPKPAQQSFTEVLSQKAFKYEIGDKPLVGRISQIPV